jgi:outer membrane protein
LRRAWSDRKLRAAVLLAALCAVAAAQDTLSVEDAEKIALKNNPRIASSDLLAGAAGKVTDQVRSAYYPTLYGSVTGVGADRGSVVAAGAVTTSSLSSRGAAGVSLVQMITDFGRTKDLTQTAKLRAQAQAKNAMSTRALVRLEVRQAYYQALSADQVLKVAQAAVAQRRTTLRQLQALAESALRSTLDVRFAEVAVSEAELAVYQAENDARESRTRLSAAMGYEQDQAFTLNSVDMPAPVDPTPDAFIALARQQRPDLLALQLNSDASLRFSEAERRLKYPSINLLGTAGEIPLHNSALPDSYSAVGVNVSIPILNGGLYAARQSEAALRAQASAKDVQTLVVAISRDVRIAWLEANTAFRRLDITARLVAQANEAMRLAQARYDNGLSGIIELTQAQFNQTSAQIGAASAKYDYLSRRAALDYSTGAL